METLTKCPACEHTLFQHYQTCTDYLVSKQQFTIVMCQYCGLRFTNPRPSGNELGNYYKSDEYISHSDKTDGLIGELYGLVRQYTVRQKVVLINQLNKGQAGKLLDIGCGTGQFLLAAKQRGWAIDGVEPDHGARNIAQKRTDKPLFDNWKSLPTNKLYDVVTMWHVLEHIPELRQLLQTVHGQLHPTGTLVVAVPNCAADDAAQYGSDWAAFDVPRHLYHFTPDVLQKIAQQAGYVLIRQKQMPFDAYYVSMLSTQHRDGSPNYLESLLTGWRSNWKARDTGNYSSITYILKKM